MLFTEITNVFLFAWVSTFQSGNFQNLSKAYLFCLDQSELVHGLSGQDNFSVIWGAFAKCLETRWMSVAQKWGHLFWGKQFWNLTLMLSVVSWEVLSKLCQLSAPQLFHLPLRIDGELCPGSWEDHRWRTDSSMWPSGQWMLNKF